MSKSASWVGFWSQLFLENKINIKYLNIGPSTVGKFYKVSALLKLLAQAHIIMSQNTFLICIHQLLKNIFGGKLGDWNCNKVHSGMLHCKYFLKYCPCFIILKLADITSFKKSVKKEKVL